MRTVGYSLGQVIYFVRLAAIQVLPILLRLMFDAFVWSMMSILSIFVGITDAAKSIASEWERKLYLTGIFPTIYSDVIHRLFEVVAFAVIVAGWLLVALCIRFSLNVLL